jgi:hypothetical protein
LFFCIVLGTNARPGSPFYTAAGQSATGCSERRVSHLKESKKRTKWRTKAEEPTLSGDPGFDAPKKQVEIFVKKKI